MSFRINTNIAAMSAQRHLTKAQRNTDHALRNLSSGSRVSAPGRDAAGFAISENLRSQISGLKQAEKNAESAISFIQTAEGSLNEQNNILMRLRELGVQAASDTMGSQEREFLDKEFQQLKDEFDRIARSARYGGKNLLTGENKEFDFQVGTKKSPDDVIKFKLDADTTSSAVGIDALHVLDKDSSLDALEIIDEGLYKILDARASFGAAQSRFEYTIDNLNNQHQNVSEARSLIADVDVAEETAKLAQAQILQELGTSVLAQANNSHERALRLLTNI